MFFNLPEIYVIRLIAFFFVIVVILFKAPDFRLRILFFLVLWVSGFGTTPFSTTDYPDYLASLERGRDYLSNPNTWELFLSNDHKAIEQVGWTAMYLVLLPLGFEASLQIISGAFLIFSVYRLFPSLLHDRNVAFLVVITILFSSSFSFFTDWYIRQGIAFSTTLLAISIHLRGGSFCRLRALIAFSIAIFFHVSTLFLVFLYILASIYPLESRSVRRSMSFGLLMLSWSLFFISFIGVARILDVPLIPPVVFDYIGREVFFYGIYTDHSRPGFLHLFYAILLTAITIRIWSCENNIAARRICIMYWGVLLAVILLQGYSSYVNRFLLGVPLVGLLLFASTFTSRYPHYKIFVLLVSVMTAFLSIFFVLLDNGGMDR